MIVAREVKFSYEKLLVLKGIDVDVVRGEVATLLGPNGSGKTTLLMCLCAILKPLTGCVYVNGREITKIKRGELAKMLGHVPQGHRPPFPYTVIDVVVMGRAPYIGAFSMPSKRDFEIAEKALEIVGIRHLKDRVYTQISGGEMQLVLIARALAQQPQVLLLDEPTAHLDFKNKILVLKVVKNLAKKENLAVIMSLHDPNLAAMFSDKVYLIADGVIVDRGEPSKVITRENLKRVYGIDVNVIEHEGTRFVVPVLE
ncbi:MAG: ABC transporter ATP-binding protein [Thermoprotei archaeon]|nr:MAG: ABC transporter ATP-binding protein [Thermoprotei archaeon]RLF22887.1 MAG: ABC transporter ATP-binding protein [Thermoprotei archaeon]